jgi:hypothetical protein
VDHAVDVRMLCKDIVQSCFVGDVNLVELGSFSAEQLNAIECYFGGVVQAVHNHNLVSMLEKSKSRKRTNIAGASTTKMSASPPPISRNGGVIRLSQS